MPARSVCLVTLSLSEAGPGRLGGQVSVTDIYHTIPPYRCTTHQKGTRCDKRTFHFRCRHQSTARSCSLLFGRCLRGSTQYRCRSRWLPSCRRRRRQRWPRRCRSRSSTCYSQCSAHVPEHVNTLDLKQAPQVSPASLFDSPHKRDSFWVFLMPQYRIPLHTKHTVKRVLRGWSLCQEGKI